MTSTPTSPAQPPIPGILLVHPRLLTPSPTTAATFLHWTKLHFRDLLRLDGVTRAMRFSAPETDTGYSHALDGEEGNKLPAYVYMCVLDDVRVVKGAPYYGVSRRLRLDEENGEKENEGKAQRDGDDGQDNEEDKSMIFDIVDAKFAVYEKLADRTRTKPFPLPLTATSAKMKCVLACVSIAGASGDATDNVPQMLHDSLFDKVNAAVPEALTTYSCLYRWAGEDAQPEMHPLIDIGGTGQWMVAVWVVDEKGKTLVREKVCALVEGWVGDCATVERAGKVGFGVWDGEFIMG